MYPLRKYSRRGWIAAAAVMLTGAIPAAKAADDTRRPNVLFIAADDMNDWTGFLGGHPQVKTPNLDRLAARGVHFTRAYCSAPACNPSRASLLTGFRPSTTGVYHNNQPWRPAAPDAVTLPQHFIAAGYKVTGGGKIFHNAYNDLPSWQEWFGLKPADHPHPAKTPVNGIANTAHFDWAPVDAPDQEMGDFKTVSWAVEQLKASDDRPFFLAVGLIRPHLPWYAPRAYFDRHPVDDVILPETKDGDLDDVPSAGVAIAKPGGDHRKVLESNQWKHAVQGYLASIEFADAQIGRLLEALEASGKLENTIIVFWGDHGWHLGQKQHWRKFALWEEATRVPLIVVAPGVTPTQARCERTVSLLDLYPTLIELCGLPTRSGLEGANLIPLLRDPAAAWDHPAVTTHGRGNHAVRTERWRYIRYADGSEELYDHDADAREWHNLAADPRWSSLKSELGRHLPHTNAEDAPTAREAGAGGF